MTTSCVVYGFLEINEADMVLDFNWVNQFDIEIFVDSKGSPIYGVECPLDVERGFTKITKKKEETVRKFMDLYMEKYPKSKVGYYTGVPYDNVADILNYTMYILNDEESDEESYDSSYDSSEGDSSEGDSSYDSSEGESDGEETPEEESEKENSESESESDEE